MNGADLMVEDYYKMLLKNNYISDLTKVKFVDIGMFVVVILIFICVVPITCRDLILFKK